MDDIQTAFENLWNEHRAGITSKKDAAYRFYEMGHSTSSKQAQIDLLDEAKTRIKDYSKFCLENNLPIQIGAYNFIKRIDTELTN